MKEHLKKINRKFSDFSLEETPMVKRAIASKIGVLQIFE